MKRVSIVTGPPPRRKLGSTVPKGRRKSSSGTPSFLRKEQNQKRASEILTGDKSDKSRSTSQCLESPVPPKKYGPRPELTNKQTLELYKAFGTFDPRGSGLIDSRGFILSLRAMTYEPMFDEVDELIAKVLGPDKKHVFDFKDFYKLMTAKMIGKDSKEDNLKAFRMFSDPGTDAIKLENLVAIAEELEEDISKEELGEMISFADTNSNGVVTFDEFVNILKRPKLE